jgi:hypothetical protein
MVKSLVDLGAGGNPQQKMREKFGVFQLLIDLSYPESQDNTIVRRRLDVSNHVKVIEEIRKLPFSNTQGKVDVAISLQNIEHLTREQGMRFLEDVEDMASKLVIIETPNGFVEQPGTNQNPFQEHLSGWSVKDFKSRGYRVLGTSGLKCLKQNRNKGEYRFGFRGIKFLDVLISRILFIHRFPNLCFNLYAYKVMTDISK